MENEVKPPTAGSGPAGHRRLNAGKLTGQKLALKMKEVWSIRPRLELDGDVRNLVLFNLAIDSKLRGCDLVRLKVGDVAAGGHGKSRGVIIQKKTGRPVQFEITENTRRSINALFGGGMPGADDYLFQSRLKASPQLSTPQYARIVQRWAASIGLHPANLWHALPEAHQGRPHLSQDRQSEGCPAPARTYQA